MSTIGVARRRTPWSWATGGGAAGGAVVAGVSGVVVGPEDSVLAPSPPRSLRARPAPPSPLHATSISAPMATPVHTRRVTQRVLASPLPRRGDARHARSPFQGCPSSPVLHPTPSSRTRSGPPALGVRVLGSAAVDLAWPAEGKVDARITSPTSCPGRDAAAVTPQRPDGADREQAWQRIAAAQTRIAKYQSSHAALSRPAPSGERVGNGHRRRGGCRLGRARRSEDWQPHNTDPAPPGRAAARVDRREGTGRTKDATPRREPASGAQALQGRDRRQWDGRGLLERKVRGLLLEGLLGDAGEFSEGAEAAHDVQTAEEFEA